MWEATQKEPLSIIVMSSARATKKRLHPRLRAPAPQRYEVLRHVAPQLCLELGCVGLERPEKTQALRFRGRRQPRLFSELTQGGYVRRLARVDRAARELDGVALEHRTVLPHDRYASVGHDAEDDGTVALSN